MLWLVLSKNKEEIYALTVEDGAIRVFDTEKDALSTFEKMYSRGCRSTYESSMSACIHYIHFQPRVVGFTTEEELRDRLLGEPPYRTVQMTSAAGRMSGMHCTQPGVEELYASGSNPKLISGVKHG